MPGERLRVGGLTPLTTIDYPHSLSAVVFCQGCPLRCRYCHNPNLLPRQGDGLLPWRDILAFLNHRRGLLDAVVFSGGEPTQQLSLSDAIDDVRAMGFKVGLHTAGIYPHRLAGLLGKLDWVGLDIKALPQDYEHLTGMPGSGRLAWQSARLLIESGLPHEMRTTVHPRLMSSKQQQRLLKRLHELGASDHRWQACSSKHCLDSTL
jgi:pyruvate formate lyase activating enzyme